MAFEKIRNRLGFGCMRLKMNDGKIDYDEFCRMIDEFIGAGFNYFDTAHGYIEGMSEIAIRECLCKRYNREDFVLANKLSSWCFEKEEDIFPFFENQLKITGVDYFDFYLFHSITRNSYVTYKERNSFARIQKIKDQGKIKHIGMSFHDTADILDMILSEQPCIEFVQLQFNYLDYDDPGTQSKKCYDVAVKHGKKVVVMEPVRGGYLANPPEQAARVFDELGNNKSYASYALRYAASFPEVFMVLSGMSDTQQMKDNIQTFTNFVPFSKEEFEAADKARAIIREVRQLKCTKCNYCTEVCSQKIPIPELFEHHNKYLGAKITKAEMKALFPKDKPSASDCVKCGKCEDICPQGIDIKYWLYRISMLK